MPEVATVGDDVVVDTLCDPRIAIRFKTESHIDRGEDDVVELLGRKLIMPDRGKRSADAAHMHQRLQARIVAP